MAQNVNVDDLDLTYSAGWKASAECDGCSAAPTAEQMRFVNKGTWHDAARQTDGDPVTMTYTFEGTGVTVYGITVNGTSARPIIKNVDLVFSINDAQAGAYTYTPDATVTDYHFNVPFFNKQDLPSGQHTLKMELQPHSFVLVDYLVYTKEAAVKPDPTTTTPNPGSTPPADSDPNGDSSNDPTNGGNDTNNNDNGASNSFAGSEDASHSTGGAQLPGPSSTSNGGGGLSTQTAITLAVLIPILVAVVVIAAFFWWLRRRSAKRQEEFLAAAQIPPPPEFYGGPGGPPTIASYHPGSPSAAMQYNPYVAAAPMHGGSGYVNPSHPTYPFAPSSHVPSSVTDEDMDIAPGVGAHGGGPSPYAGIVAAPPPPVVREKRGMPPNIQPAQYGPVPPLYSP
ncbi:hypothetical protein AURDEDRAFT_112191 [Auricularia subglabra TFB-10046 SS5]|nr:hypothetical protein AURDEDRAFT_112191 [Auricularia subglabra TFB-10046 SS5]